MSEPVIAQRLLQIEHEVEALLAAPDAEQAPSLQAYLLQQVEALQQAGGPDEMALAGLMDCWIDSLAEQEGLRSAAQQAEEEKQAFVSTVTHELRIPLTALKGYSDLLSREFAGPLNERQRDFLAIILRNLDRMAALLGDLGDLNRLQGGRLPLERSRFTLAEAIDRALATTGPLLTSREHSLTLDIDPALPELEADLERTAQAFSILLDNAARYTAQGGEIIVRAEAAGRMAQIAVIDNGIGMSAAEQAELFTPFFRSEDAWVRDEPGWGLGLALARGVIESQGGEIEVASQPGSGTTVSFTIPLAESEV